MLGAMRKMIGLSLLQRLRATMILHLKPNVTVGEFVKDSKINVLVQDEIPVSPDDYDYTFVWMSDTQYYSESYPYIFDRQTQWIVEKARGNEN